MKRSEINAAIERAKSSLRVNDDASDNLFLDALARFPAIVEDAPPTHLLCNEC
jgi:D-lyxose ketol-isomerase